MTFMKCASTLSSFTSNLFFVFMDFEFFTLDLSSTINFQSIL